MRSFFALIKKDLKGYFDQPTGYVLLVLFTGVASFFFFRSVLSTGEASLRPLFANIVPWMLAVFVPAATMRLMAEEQRDGTLEILLTQPVRSWSVLFAKFLAGLGFVSIGIAFTIGVPLALTTAGGLDWGAIGAQYIGTFFLTASFVAVGLFTSSLTRNQIVAFILGLAIIAALMLAGMPVVALTLPSEVAVLVVDLSPLTHFDAIARGVLELRDFLYFVALVSTFLSGTYLLIRAKSVSHHSPLYRNLQLGVGGLVVISLLVGWFGRSIEGRWDLTENKLYSLSDATETILSDLDDIVTLKLFASKDPPVQVAQMTREVNDFLDDLAARSDGKVRVLRRFPGEDEEDAAEAEAAYVPPVQFNIESQGEFRQKIAYLGLGMTHANNREVIQFISSLEGLEYEIISSIYRMAQKEPKLVAFLAGHGEKRRLNHLLSFHTELDRHHDIIEIQEDEEADVLLDLSGVSVLIVPGPTQAIRRSIRHDIDEFLSNGGNALFLIDPVSVNDRQLTAEANEFSLADYLRQYGVSAHTDVVFDPQSNTTLTFGAGTGQVARTVRLPYPYWVRVPTVERKISGGVPAVVFPWASSLEISTPTESTVDVEITPLLETTRFAAVDTEFQDISVQSPRTENVSEQEQGERLLAVAIAGTRCEPVNPSCKKDPDDLFRIIVATDSDWLSENTNSILRGSPADLFSDHTAMAVNWVDWLTQEDELATLRAKGPSIRRLTFTSDTHRNLVQYANIAGVPSLFVLLGLLRFIMRRTLTRRVYTRER